MYFHLGFDDMLVLISIFSKTAPEFSLLLLLTVANTGSLVGQQNKVGHPAHRFRRLLQASCAECPRIINRLQNMCCFCGFVFRNYEYNLGCGLKKKETCCIMTCVMNNLEIE